MPFTIGITTGGGDAPGLNAAIEAVCRTATARGWTVLGIRDGFDGILTPDNYPMGDGVSQLRASDVIGIASSGGTILGAASTGNPFKEHPVAHVVDKLRTYGIEALVTVGGDGTQQISNTLHEAGMRVIGAPKTIDNDLVGTVTSFGFDSAVECVVECIDRLRTTADAHQRTIVVEVMGRHAGWIALHGGLAGDADAILIPENPFDIHALAQHIEQRRQTGQRSNLVVVAEGAVAQKGGAIFDSETHRLSGIGEEVARRLRQLTTQEVRAVNLGHLVRGGTPTASDRLLGLRLGAAVVRAIADGKSGIMVAWDGAHTIDVPLKDVAGHTKNVPANSDALTTARELDIFLGT